MSDFAESLFADLTDSPPDAPAAEYYPGSKRKIPTKPAPAPTPKTSEQAWDRHPLRLTVGGVEAEFFTIGALAEAINRRPVTIRSWEAKGVIPKARYRTSGKTQTTGGNVAKRLYSRRQVEGLIALCAKHGILEFQARPDAIPVEFTDDVIALWKEDLK